MSSAKILVVEDEPKVALFIKKGLEENNFGVQVASNGYMGKELALNGKFDAVILDLKLPVVNGYEVCREIRKTNSAIPVLILTALSTTDDKLNGFSSGADDYLVKPFEFRELLARIRALLKRSQQNTTWENILKIADLELNTETKAASRNKKIIELTAKEFYLLELLMRNKGKVISRADIAEKIWEINYDPGTNVIDVYINFLRKKIDKGHAQKLIHTHIGMGYVIKEGD
jgi:two-component system copper resistance phosphate regulon response regulator CusR